MPAILKTSAAVRKPRVLRRFLYDNIDRNERGLQEISVAKGRRRCLLPDDSSSLGHRKGQVLSL